MTAATPEPTGSPAQLCAEHRDRASIATCPRCGRFACEECWGVRGLCRPCLLALASALPRTEPRARWAARFFIIVAASETAALAANVTRLWGEQVTPWALDAVRVLPTLGGTLGAMIAFLIWLHLLTRHLQALRLDVDTTPAWSVLWWFVPIAHLFMPYLVVRSHLKAIGGAALARASAASWWWATWIAGTAFTYLGKHLTGRWIRFLMATATEGPGVFEKIKVLGGQLRVAQAAWEVFASCALLIAAALAVRLIRTAQRGLATQMATLEVQGRAHVTAPAA